MNWKTNYRSFYYQKAPEPEGLELPHNETMLLSIDIQNTYLESPHKLLERERWAPFQRKMRELVIPNIQNLQKRFRAMGMDVLHARIVCLLNDGRDRSLSQKKLGWNYLLLPKDEIASQIVPDLAPQADESFNIVVVEDCCAAGTNELHRKELEIINMIYCNVSLRMNL